MKKIKAITSISNSNKTVILRFELKEEIIKKIDEIFLKLEPEGDYFEYYNKKTGSDYSHQPKHLKDITFRIFDKEETGFVIFKSKSIEMILLKDSSMFKDMEKEIFSVFDFIKPVKIKHKA